MWRGVSLAFQYLRHCLIQLGASNSRSTEPPEQTLHRWPNQPGTCQYFHPPLQLPATLKPPCFAGLLTRP
jgi:hypothetical protein